jgi:GGDEF domain-containing protein
VSQSFHATLIPAGTTSAFSLIHDLSALTARVFTTLFQHSGVARVKNLLGTAMFESPLFFESPRFASPRHHFRQRLWLVPWLMSLLLPASLFFRHPLFWGISSVLLVGFTFVCWRYRRSKPEMSLVLSLAGILTLTLGAFLVTGRASDDASVISLFMVLAVLPLTGLIALRPVFGLGAMLATVLLMSFQGMLKNVVLYIPALTASFLGLFIAAVLNDYERIHASLSEAAVTDPITGLGNFYSLKMDFRRYQALAQRENHALLLMRWGFEHVKELGQTPGLSQTPGLGHTTGTRVPFQFTTYLSQCIRQGDGLYYLGEREFISLHPKLESGADLAARVQQIYPGVQVSWARGDSQSLVEVLTLLKQSGTSSSPAVEKSSRWLS